MWLSINKARGKIVVRDTEGSKYVAEVHGIVLFSSGIKVVFGAESDYLYR